MGETQNDILNINTEMAICNRLGKKKTEEAGKGIVPYRRVMGHRRVPTEAPFLEKFTLYFQSKPLNASEQESKLTVEKYREAGKCHKSEETGPGSNPGPRASSADVLRPGPRRPPLIPARCVNTRLRAAGQRSVCCVGHGGPRRSWTLGQRDVYQVVRGGENVGLPPGETGFSAAANSK